MPIIPRDADLTQLPQQIVQASGVTHISMGDSHGNALKMIYTLLEEGIMTLKPLQREADITLSEKEQYSELVRIYFTPSEGLTSEDLILFKSILSNSSIDTAKSVTFVGDTLADRGQNDLLTLLLLERLHRLGLPFDILLSNHDVEFIKDYERDEFTGEYNLQSHQGISLKNMCDLISRGLVQETEVRELVTSFYLPHVKAINYTVSGDAHLTIYTHAPVGLETIQAIAEAFEIVYDDSSIESLTCCIDTINLKIQALLKEKKLGSYINSKSPSLTTHSRYPIPLAEPLLRLTWNRVLVHEFKSTPSGLFPARFVHGHIGPYHMTHDGITRVSALTNLDTLLGKDSRFLQTRHVTLHSSDLGSLDYNIRRTIIVEQTKSLFEACTAGEIEKVKALLSPTDYFSIDLMAQNSKGLTPLDVAKGKGHTDIYELLKKRLQEQRTYYLMSACYHGNVSAAHSLLSAIDGVLPRLDACNTSDDNLSLIEVAMKHQHPNIAFLIQERLKKQRTTSLIEACKTGDLTLIGELLNPKDGIMPSLYVIDESKKIAEEKGNAAIVSRLEAQNQCNVNLLKACFENDIFELQKVLNRTDGIKPDLLYTNAEGKNACHLAAIHANPGILLALQKNFQKNIFIEAVNSKNKSGHTPLAITCMSPPEKATQAVFIAQTLIGVPYTDKSSPDELGNTPIAHACANNHLKIVEFLAQVLNPAQVNQPNQEGRTPLGQACYDGCTDIVNVLIPKFHADQVVLEDAYYRKTPYQIAKEHDHIEIVAIIYKIIQRKSGKACSGAGSCSASLFGGAAQETAAQETQEPPSKRARN